MARLVNDSGVLGDSMTATAENINEIGFDKIIEAIHTVQDNMGIAGTTAEEAATTVEGSFNSMKSAATNFLTSLGSSELNSNEAFGKLTDSVKVFGDNALPVIKEIIESILGINPAVSGVVAAVGAFAASGILSSKIPMLLTSVKSLGAAFLSLSSPVTIVIALIAGVVAAFVGLYNSSEEFRSAVDGLVSTLGSGFASVLPSIQGFLSQLGEAFSGALNAVIPLLTNVFNTLATIDWESVFGTIVSSITTLAAQAQPILETLFNLILQAAQTILPILQQAFVALSPIVSTVFGLIMTVVTNALNIIQGVISAFEALVSGDWDAFFASLHAIAESIWNIISALFSTAASAIQGIVSGLVSAVVGFFQSLWTSIVNKVGAMWLTVSTTFSNGVTMAIGYVSKLPSEVISIFSGAGSWLINSGKSLIQGLIDGITSAFSNAKSVVEEGLSGLRALFPFSPAKEGPFSGKGWTLYSGMAIADSIGEGFGKEADSVKKRFEGELEGIQSAVNITANVGGSSRSDQTENLYEAVKNALTELSVGVFIDGRELAGATAGYMSTKLGVMEARAAR